MCISATAKTSDNNQAVTATSSNPGVARVELTKVYNGYDCRFSVKFNGVGAATITITSEDGNVSKHDTIIVYDSYETPIGRRLTPEQFVTCMNGILVENGARINTTMGWLMMTLSDSDLTGDNARAIAESCIRDFWPNGIRGMGLAYQGIDEDGNHVFYIHR